MKRKVYKYLVILLLIAFVAVFGANKIITSSSRKAVYTDADSIPKNKAGLLLGTSKLLKSGKPNQYFQFRIDAAIQLFKKKKIEDIVISGDNSRENYNEPEDMKKELMKKGVPEERIYLDYAGFRTFDSVYRMHEIFGQESFTIISQEFHNQRAVYIASQLGLKAVAFNAKDVNAYNGFKTKVREKLARAKVFIDFAFDKKPKFSGEKIQIE
jgi:SanA protein